MQFEDHSIPSCYHKWGVIGDSSPKPHAHIVAKGTFAGKRASCTLQGLPPLLPIWKDLGRGMCRWSLPTWACWLSCGLREGSFCWALRSGSGVGDGSRPQPLGRPAYGKLGAPLGTRHWTCVLLLTSEFPAGAEATRAGGQLTAKPGSSPSGSETSKSS